MSQTPTSDPVPSQVPASIQEQLLKIGRVVEPRRTALLYASLQQPEPYDGVQAMRAQQYGPDPRNLLDMFASQSSGSSRPMLVFLHGGAFTGGERRRDDGPFYDNIMLWAVKHGMVGVNMTYRLAPLHQWPAAQLDIGAALSYVRQNADAVGGDTGRIVLMGHSAGAAHIAQYLAHPQFHVVPGGGVAGAVLLSGLFDTATAERSPPMQSYFGTDASLYPQRSAVPGLVAAAVPLLLAYAELDPPDFHTQSAQAHAALRLAGRSTPLLKLMGHSHMSEVYAINTADRSLSDPLAAFVRSLR